MKLGNTLCLSSTTELMIEENGHTSSSPAALRGPLPLPSDKMSCANLVEIYLVTVLLSSHVSGKIQNSNMPVQD